MYKSIINFFKPKPAVPPVVTPSLDIVTWPTVNAVIPTITPTPTKVIFPPTSPNRLVEKEDNSAMYLTPSILLQFAPSLGASASILVNILNGSAVVDTPLRLAHFLAQTGHESALFSISVENMNYSEQGLSQYFSKYFPTQELRKEYARKPERIGNRVYANRMGNGPESSGDGYRYRGRGYLQVTGKNNYRIYSRDAYGDDRMLSTPELLGKPEDAIGSALHWWNSNNANLWADRDDVLAVSRLVNLGNAKSKSTPNGMVERRKYLDKAKKLLKI